MKFVRLNHQKSYNFFYISHHLVILPQLLKRRSKLESAVVSKVDAAPTSIRKQYLYFFFRYHSSVNSQNNFDVAIVGGGIVGLATARELMIRNPNLSCSIIEKETQLSKSIIPAKLFFIIAI